MFTTKHNFTAGEFSPRMKGRTDYEKYKNACLTMKNAYAIPHGPVVNRPGTRFIAECKNHHRKVRLIPFEFSEEQAYVLECGHGYIRYYTDGGQITWGGQPYETDTDYTEDQLFEIDYTQSADYLFLVHKYHHPAHLTRTAHNVWNYSYIDFTDPPSDWDAAPLDLTPSAGTASLSPSDSPSDSASSSPSDDTPSTSVSSSPSLGTPSDTPSSSVSSSPSSSVSSSPSLGTGTASSSPSSSPSGGSGTASTSPSSSPSAGTPSDTPSGSVSSSPSADTPSTSPSESTPSASPEDYPVFPSCVNFFEQRLIFAASPTSPQTIWGSTSADYFNFTVPGTLTDDSPFTYTISSDQVNKIQWISPSAALFIGTMGGEWIMTGGSGNPVTPTSVRVVRESTRGSIKHKPLVVGDERMFVQRPGHAIRQISYVFETDSYNAFALDILAEHMLRSSSVVDWCYQQTPHSIIWAVRDDGALIGCTYVKEHKVIAFHQHDTEGGYFESICSIPGDKEDDVYVVVRRTINGETKRYIEKLEEVFDSQDTDSWYEDAFFVDSGLSYSGTAVSSVSGLDHLEGQTVAILADGSVRAPQTVVSGSVSIGAPAASVIHVGLPITADVESMPIEAELQDGMSGGRKKRLTEVVFEFLDSIGFSYGKDFDDMDEHPFRTPADELGEGLGLFTGRKRVHWPRGWSREQTICFRQDQPLPMMIAGYTAEYEVEK